VVAAAFNPVGERSPKPRAFVGELVDGILDEVGYPRVALAERQVLGLDLMMEP
jgi:hypothetical protein